MHRFEPSPDSYAGEDPAAGGLFDKLTGAFSAGSASISGWSSLLSALTDPRERVAVLKAKIANYQTMKKKYGIGPIGDLYANEIRLMKARLAAEKKALALQGEGEDSTRNWRIAGLSLAGLVGVLLAAKAYAAIRAPRVSNPTEDRTRYNDAHRLRQEGLAYYRDATRAERRGDHREAERLRKYGDRLSERGEDLEELARRSPHSPTVPALPSFRSAGAGVNGPGSESSRREVDELLAWLRTSEDRQRIAADMLALYDADPAMSHDSGVRFALRYFAGAS